VSLLALLLAWGRNLTWFNEFVFDRLPGYNKFRAVSTTLVIVQWAAPSMAALALGRLWRNKYSRGELVRAVKPALYWLGGLALFFALFGGMLFDFVAPSDGYLAQQGMPNDVLAAMRGERASMLRMDALRSLIFVGLTAGVILLWGKIGKGWFVVLTVGLTAADLTAVDMRFVPHDKFVEPRRNEIQPTAADRTILSDATTGFRVANHTTSAFNDATTSYFHRSIGGYHGAKLQRYQEVVERYLAPRNPAAYNMLNVRYIINFDSTGRHEAQLNQGAFGAAWFVERVREVADADEAIAALGKVDLRREAVVEKRDGGGDMVPARAETANDTIALVDYRVNYQKYTYTAAAPAVAVFSEIYYPFGWSCALDGQPMEYFRADYILRAAALPAGSHTVEFRFAAPHYALLAGINRWTTVLILLLAAGAIAWSVYDGKRRENGAGE
jgi:hypothetical protein